jgi:hypothetical protein
MSIVIGTYWAFLWDRFSIAVWILFVHVFLLKFYNNLKNIDMRKCKSDALIYYVIIAIIKQ